MLPIAYAVIVFFFLDVSLCSCLVGHLSCDSFIWDLVMVLLDPAHNLLVLREYRLVKFIAYCALFQIVGTG